ncbi:MAG TPA: amidohydrolase family protein, partial [Myxococcota bacterium]|nr:amidohydrolase family protein [Myxococcota bacterium]
MLDVRIDGGTLVDGTGAPGRVGSLGIRDGKIVALGEVSEPAKRVIDATGRVVAPGFVDIHTHYDAQVFWDPTISPSSYHGVTTVVGGNCGFSIAPLTPEAGAYLMPMLARVEGMPIETLKAGVPWDWSTFGEYLAKLDGKLALNAGFLVGHSAIRRVVMKERAVGHEATPEELAQMVELLQKSLREGGLGFSTSLAATHNDGDGEPVPSRHASREEVVALARAIRDLPGTTLEAI